MFRRPQCQFNIFFFFYTLYLLLTKTLYETEVSESEQGIDSLIPERIKKKHARKWPLRAFWKYVIL